MEFLSDIFVKFWKEAIVAMLLTAVLPFLRRYVRRRRAKVINFFKEKKYLTEALRESQDKRKEAEREVERLRLELKREQRLREETEQNYHDERSFTCSDEKWNEMIKSFQEALENGNMKKGNIGLNASDFTCSEAEYEMLPKAPGMSDAEIEAFLKKFTESYGQRCEIEKEGMQS